MGKFCFKNKDIYITCHIFLRVVFSFTMFGDLFEEDYSSVSNNNGNPDGWEYALAADGKWNTIFTIESGKVNLDEAQD